MQNHSSRNVYKEAEECGCHCSICEVIEKRNGEESVHFCVDDHKVVQLQISEDGAPGILMKVEIREF